MQKYVCGFLFSTDYEHVVLIQKLKPAWQAGKLNGLGGKMEEGETPLQAMQREFKEECGLDIPNWAIFHREVWRDSAEVWFLAAETDGNSLSCVRSLEAEQVRVHFLEFLNRYQLMYNLPYLIPMAKCFLQNRKGWPDQAA